MDPRAILIGGSSHLGKSTLAARLAERLGWIHISTDSLARHPGRPWRTAPHEVPPHVVEHYSTLDVEALMASVLAHYRGMGTTIEALIRKHLAADQQGLVLEGSALWPETIGEMGLRGASAVWLTAPPELIEARIRAESRYRDADGPSRALIDKFIARSLAYDAAMMAAVRRLGLAWVDIGEAPDVDTLAAACLGRMQALA